MELPNLAIVIPAYKKAYFEVALNSLASQTNKNFNVYIGDDNSPENLKPVADLFSKELNIYYTKFTNNIGAKKLVHQWNRCIALTKYEEWIWLFSDDDVAHENCVENFYKESKYNYYDVFRFNTVVIDGTNNIIKYTVKSPKIESSEELAYNILLGKRGNCMPDHIFSRKVYEASGGIVETDFAQGADWATSILFSRNKGLCIIDDAVLFWRYTANNISGKAYLTKDETTLGHVQFLEWVLNHFQYLKSANSPVTYDMMRKAVIRNFKVIVTSHYRGYNSTIHKQLFDFLRHKAGLSALKSTTLLLEIKIDCATPIWLKSYYQRFIGLVSRRLHKII